MIREILYLTLILLGYIQCAAVEPEREPQGELPVAHKVVQLPKAYVVISMSGEKLYDCPPWSPEWSELEESRRGRKHWPLDLKERALPYLNMKGKPCCPRCTEITPFNESGHQFTLVFLPKSSSCDRSCGKVPYVTPWEKPGKVTPWEKPGKPVWLNKMKENMYNGGDGHRTAVSDLESLLFPHPGTPQSSITATPDRTYMQIECISKSECGERYYLKLRFHYHLHGSYWALSTNLENVIGILSKVLGENCTGEREMWEWAETRLKDEETATLKWGGLTMEKYKPCRGKPMYTVTCHNEMR